MPNDGQRGYHHPATPEHRSSDSCPARADALEPTAPDGRGGTEEYEEQGEHPPHHRDFPVATGGGDGREETEARGTLERLGMADSTVQRQPKHREAVCHPDAKVNCQSTWRHQPA